MKRDVVGTTATFAAMDNAVRTSQLALTLVGPGQVNQLKHDHKDENTN
jgi:hypothetical protein